MRDPHAPGPATSNSHFSRRTLLRLNALLFFFVLMIAGCSSEPSGKSGDYVYVAVPETALRDRVANVSGKTGVVHNGERLQVLERMQNRRFVRVRTSSGEEGWVSERYLADQQTFDQFKRAAEQYKDTPAQGTATVVRQIPVHGQPGRKTPFLYVLDEKQKVALLQRRPVNRNSTPTQAKDADTDNDTSDDDAPSNSPPAIWDDWWLIRDAQQRIGWVLGSALYLEVPDEIGQYAEGQRIVAAFPLDQVEDQGNKVGEYLVLLTQPKNGLPFDFDQIRVYTWNTRKHRYETAYRERNLDGSLPVTLGQQDFEKEGLLRTFTLRLRQEGGEVKDQLYKFRPPMVRKVYAPGEEPPAKAGHKSGHHKG